MADYTLTYKLEGLTPQKATAMRDSAHAHLQDHADGDVVVRSSAMSEDGPRFRVVGVDTSTSEVVDEVVMAADEAAAQAAVETADVVVADVAPTN